jgi:tetratricopeptide (TPR) repeat protein
MTGGDGGPGAPAAAAAVAALIAAGDYVGAARSAAASGDLRRAIQLYERVWRFAEAVPLAEQLGDRALAARLAIDAGQPARAQAIADGVPVDQSAELTALIDVFAGRGRWAEAAALAQRASQHGRAADLYRRAGALMDAARSLVRAGAWPEAGRLFEEVAQGARADDPALEAEARLEYGTLCAQLGRPRDAVRALQIAAAHPSTRAAALARMVFPLGALGLPHAAQVIAQRLGDLGSDERAQNAAALAATDGDAHAAATAQLARFTDLVLIGGGRTGRVFRARDRLLEQTVVLKMMGVGGGSIGLEQQAFRQFLREAEASSRLSHPNIVRLHDVDERAGLLVMEYLAGGTLADLVAAQGPLAPAAVRRIALDVLGALEAAHRAGIVHRDIKPANIFLDAAGNAKLADFGAAHLADFGGTQTAGFIGTLGYLSPEQISGGSIGPAADLYGLGATLFEALTGRLPFVGADIAGQHLGTAVPRPSDLRPALLPLHDQVILRALAKNPVDRFASASAMATAIRAWPAAIAAPEGSTPLPLTSGPLPTNRPAGAAAAPEDAGHGAEVALGPTARGQLVQRHDGRLGRRVLIEILATPLDQHGITQLAALAAAGGPRVQRVLRLEDELRIVYEALPDDGVCLGDLPSDQRRLLDDAWPALAPAGVTPTPRTRVTRTAEGPVILVVTVLGQAYSAMP